MAGDILVINSGSSSLKFALFAPGPDAVARAHASGEVSGLGGSAHLRITAADGSVLLDQPVARADHEGAIHSLQQWLRQSHLGTPAAVGHRVVHGGTRFLQPVRIDAEVLHALQGLVPLAPLHQPHQLAAIRAVQASTPQVPQVACFDTAFHADMPAIARSYALPQALSAEGIRVYGFHGLSYEYIASVLPQQAPTAGARVVVAHLGSGASLCALRDGHSVATTMGLTPLDGVPMATRCGAIDPGVLLYLMRERGMSAETLQTLLYEQSGLLGMSGLSADVRTLTASAQPGARAALELFVYRIGRELGSLCAALGGLDALVFTGGIGEHSAAIRAQVCRDAAWLGIRIDEAANQSEQAVRLSSPASTVSVWRIPTDENLMVARHVRQLLEL